MEVEMRGLPLDRISNYDYYSESSLRYGIYDLKYR